MFLPFLAELDVEVRGWASRSKEACRRPSRGWGVRADLEKTLIIMVVLEALTL